jgi:hypothetical protein
MTIWLLALLLLGGTVAVGYTQGAIRVGFSFIGIIVSALLAVPLSKFVKPALSALGVANPIWLWVLGPFIVFVILLAAFKVGALAVHKKVDVYYKYKAGDLRQALWERINARLGACLGLLNGLAYLVLISWVAFSFGYWTTQLSSEEGDPKMMRLLTRLGKDVQSTGLAKAARAIDRMPPVFYEAADFAGLLFHHPLAEARLSRYPAFLTLAEKPEFQALGQDQSFSALRLSRKPLQEVFDNPSFQAIKTPEMMKHLWGLVTPDLKDLNDYLTNGISEKYDDKILGRWTFDVNAAMMAHRRAKPNTSSTEMQRVRLWMQQSFARTKLVVAPDGTAIVKDLPQLSNPTATDLQTIEGQWKASGSQYQFTLGSAGNRRGRIEGGRLFIDAEGVTLVFQPED